MQRMGYQISRGLIDRHITTLPAEYEDVPSEAKYCCKCGALIDYNEEYYGANGEHFCSFCDWALNDMLDEHIADLLGYHIPDEALEAVMSSIVKENNEL